MGLIAFGYIYHYLNWFSKTSIIQWHDIPRSRFTAVIGIWLLSVGVYLLPLDHLTLINIGKETKAILRPPAPIRPAQKGRPIHARG